MMKWSPTYQASQHKLNLVFMNSFISFFFTNSLFLRKTYNPTSCCKGIIKKNNLFFSPLCKLVKTIPCGNLWIRVGNPCREDRWCSTMFGSGSMDPLLRAPFLSSRSTRLLFRTFCTQTLQIFRSNKFL